MYKNAVQIERLNELLAYDGDTGLLTWKITRNSRVKAGDQAGTLDRLGYFCVRIDFVQYGSHRVGWALHTGSWPTGDIDHINGNRADNRIENLRDVTRSVNLQNQRRAHKDSKSGTLGVKQMSDGRFKAQITRDYKRHDIGTFETAEEASSAYLKAKRLLHAGCHI